MVKTGDIVHTSDGPVSVLSTGPDGTAQIVFHEPPCITTTALIGNLRTGLVRNRYKPTVCGHGFLGNGPHVTSKDKRPTPHYRAWCAMLNRVYGSDSSLSVDPSWHDFQIFAEWYQSQIINGNKDLTTFKWVVDKDLLRPGNKRYGPTNCCLIPSVINTLFNVHESRNRDLPVGVIRYGKRFTAHVSRFDTGNRNLGTFDTARAAAVAYWDAKCEAIRHAGRAYFWCLPPELAITLSQFGWKDAQAYFGDIMTRGIEE